MWIVLALGISAGPAHSSNLLYTYNGLLRVAEAVVVADILSVDADAMVVEIADIVRARGNAAQNLSGDRQRIRVSLPASDGVDRSREWPFLVRSQRVLLFLEPTTGVPKQGRGEIWSIVGGEGEGAMPIVDHRVYLSRYLVKESTPLVIHGRAFAGFGLPVTQVVDSIKRGVSPSKNVISDAPGKKRRDRKPLPRGGSTPKSENGKGGSAPKPDRQGPP